jgi:diguanylate cyclase (GGDEF)-like protein
MRVKGRDRAPPPDDVSDPPEGPDEARPSDDHERGDARDQALSDSDQARSARNRTHSDSDQTQSDRDQTLSDLDQQASDDDQEASDLDRDHGADPTASREQATAVRAGTTRERREVGHLRYETAGQRDQEGEERDKVAAQRDRDADIADQRASELDSDPLGARERAGLARERAARDRKQAASDRELAAHDREEAREDRERAGTDELTGARRRGVGLEEFKREIDRARRTGENLVAAYVDVDGLKQVNDTHGHAAGDELLRQVVHGLRRHMRSYDLVVRLGGDEFLCVLPGVSLDEARRRFDAVNSELPGSPSATSVSIGLTELRDGEESEELIGRADRELIAGRHGDAGWRVGRAFRRAYGR